MVKSTMGRDLNNFVWALKFVAGFTVRNQSLISIFAMAGLALPLAIFAQTAPHAAAAKTRASSAAPDLSGVWFIDEYRRNMLPKEDPPLQPWAETLFKERMYQNTHRGPDTGPDPTERCIPPGIPRTM